MANKEESSPRKSRLTSCVSTSINRSQRRRHQNNPSTRSPLQPQQLKRHMQQHSPNAKKFEGQCFTVANPVTGSSNAKPNNEMKLIGKSKKMPPRRQNPQTPKSEIQPKIGLPNMRLHRTFFRESRRRIPKDSTSTYGKVPYANADH